MTMSPGFLKSIAGLIVAIMSFLGWNVDEYKNFLPKEIRNEIVLEEVKAPAPEVTMTVTDTTPKEDQQKKLEEKPKVSPTKQSTKKVTTQKKPQPKVKPVTQTVQPKTKINPPVVTPPQVTPTPTPTPAPKIITPPVTPTPPVVETPQVPEPKKQTISVEEKVKQSTVNIYCSRIMGNRIQKTTGSGVIISSNGVIITNSHVAEYFLLAQNGNNTSCYIRTGSPASNSFKAKLVYLPSVWINNNKSNLSQSTLTGTGENDYALLVITDKVSKSVSMANISYLDTSSSELSKNDSLILAGYPAGFSDVKLLDSGLYALLKYSSVTNIASFSESGVDVINTAPTVIAEHGSSGGAVTDTSGILQAIIVATNIDSYSGQKNIQAITLPYIKRSIKNNSGKSFDYLVSNASTEAVSFEKNSVANLANVLLSN